MTALLRVAGGKRSASSAAEDRVTRVPCPSSSPPRRCSAAAPKPPTRRPSPAPSLGRQHRTIARRPPRPRRSARRAGAASASRRSTAGRHDPATAAARPCTSSIARRRRRRASATATAPGAWPPVLTTAGCPVTGKEPRAALLRDDTTPQRQACHVTLRRPPALLLRRRRARSACSATTSSEFGGPVARRTARRHAQPWIAVDRGLSAMDAVGAVADTTGSSGDRGHGVRAAVRGGSRRVGVATAGALPVSTRISVRATSRPRNCATASSSGRSTSVVRRFDGTKRHGGQPAEGDESARRGLRSGEARLTRQRRWPLRPRSPAGARPEVMGGPGATTGPLGGTGRTPARGRAAGGRCRWSGATPAPAPRNPFPSSAGRRALRSMTIDTRTCAGLSSAVRRIRQRRQRITRVRAPANRVPCSRASARGTSARGSGCTSPVATPVGAVALQLPPRAVPVAVHDLTRSRPSCGRTSPHSRTRRRALRATIGSRKAR